MHPLRALSRWGLGLAWALAALACAVHAQPAAPQRESAVKAAYLHKFGGFVEWPPGVFQRADDPLVIGVAGDDAVAADLELLAATRPAEGRPVAVRRVREGEAVAGVHVLFAGTVRGRPRENLPAVSGPVLVVTDQGSGLRLGGVINFAADGGRMRFTVSLANAESRGLRLSSRLLAVAQNVEGRVR